MSQSNTYGYSTFHHDSPDREMQYVPMYFEDTISSTGAGEKVTYTLQFFSQLSGARVLVGTGYSGYSFMMLQEIAQ